MTTYISIIASVMVLCFCESVSADSTGTGFLVSEDGYIVTNYHVVKGSGRLLIKYMDTTLEAKIVAADSVNDIALLKVATGGHPFPFLRVNSSINPYPGSEVFTIGFPDPTVLGLTPKTTRGSVTANAGIQDDPRFLQISVPIQPGNSGGPLVDLTGSVVGITTSTIDALNRLRNSGYLPQNVNYALKASYLRRVFAQIANGKFGGTQTGQAKELKFEDVQRATQNSVVLIIAIEAGDTGNPRAESSPARASAPAEEAQPITYIGHVGRLEAIFFLKWLEEGKVQGTYFYPKRGIDRSYVLAGVNPEPGKLVLTEYTEKLPTAQISMEKTMSQDTIIWTGTMHNTDGRIFEVSFQRER